MKQEASNLLRWDCVVNRNETLGIALGGTKADTRHAKIPQ
jgi:hypothetical protein